MRTSQTQTAPKIPPVLALGCATAAGSHPHKATTGRTSNCQHMQQVSSERHVNQTLIRQCAAPFLVEVRAAPVRAHRPRKPVPCRGAHFKRRRRHRYHSAKSKSLAGARSRCRRPPRRGHASQPPTGVVSRRSSATTSRTRTASGRYPGHCGCVLFRIPAPPRKLAPDCAAAAPSRQQANAVGDVVVS